MQRKSGFTLVEAAISVMVIGILLGMGTKYYRTWVLQQAEQITNERLDTIRNTIKSHVMTVSWLPCPAPLTETQDTALYGQETDCSNATIPPGITDVAGRGGFMVRIGTVPVRALGLPDSYMTDAWGHRFLYAVTRDMATGPASNYRNSEGAIFLHDLNDHSVTETDGNGLYVLISHGKSGHGAYLANGTLFQACDGTGPGAPPDGENCNGDATFKVSRSRSENSGSDTFDDFIRYDVKDYVPAPAVSRYILDTFPCDSLQGGASASLLPPYRNCATYKFSGLNIYDVTSMGQAIYSKTVTAKTDGTVMVRAIVPVVYDNSLTANKWEAAIMGALEINGVVVSRSILVDPSYNSQWSTGSSGMLLGSAAITKDTDYTVTVRLFSLGNNSVITQSAWAGTVDFGLHSYNGMIEIMEGAINSTP